MPFDPKQPFGTSSATGVVRQNGKWWNCATGKECSEEGTPLDSKDDATRSAEILAEKATVGSTLADRNNAKMAERRGEAVDDTAAYDERLALLSDKKYAELKKMAAQLVELSAANGVVLELPAAGAGAADRLREFIAANSE